MSAEQVKPARGRPKSEEKNRQIMDAAVALFMRQGYDGVSMDQIADEAGVSKQTVYSHFGSKEDLFQQAVACKCIIHGLTDEFFDDTRPVRDVLLDIGNQFVELLLSEEAVYVYRLVVGGAEQHETLAKLYYEAGPMRVMEALTRYLSRQAMRGTVKMDDPAMATRQFLFMLKGEAQLVAVLGLDPAPSEKELARYIERCVDLFLKGYGTP